MIVDWVEWFSDCIRVCIWYALRLVWPPFCVCVCVCVPTRGGKVFRPNFVSSENAPNMTTDQTADTFWDISKTLFSTLSQQHASMVSTFPSKLHRKVSRRRRRKTRREIFFFRLTTFTFHFFFFSGYFYVSSRLFSSVSLLQHRLIRPFCFLYWFDTTPLVCAYATLSPFFFFVLFFLLLPPLCST